MVVVVVVVVAAAAVWWGGSGSCSCSCSCLSIYLSIHPSIYLSINLSICLSVCPSASLKMKLFCETSSLFELDIIKNAAILRDFLNLFTWQRQKRSNSARLPQSFHLTASKTKQFCETSSIFEVDNIKHKAILRDFLRKWKVECRADGLVPMRFAISPLHLSKVLCLPQKKVRPGHTKCCKCCTYHTKSSYQTWRSDAPKCNPSQELSVRTS